MEAVCAVEITGAGNSVVEPAFLRCQTVSGELQGARLKEW